MISNVTSPQGSLVFEKIERQPTPLSIETIAYYSQPNFDVCDEVNEYRARNWENVERGFSKMVIADEYNIPAIFGILWGCIIRDGKYTDLGIISTRVVTTAGATKIVDFMRTNDTATGQAFKYHGLGTGSTSEAAGDTALVTELTTEYVGNTRATGTQTNNGATTYRSVGTVTLDSGTPALREHGIFSAASGGTLLDRSVFSAVNLNGSNGDGFQATYDLLISAGG